MNHEGSTTTSTDWMVNEGNNHNKQESYER
jgi:hypothetical protein